MCFKVFSFVVRILNDWYILWVNYETFWYRLFPTLLIYSVGQKSGNLKIKNARSSVKMYFNGYNKC